MDLLAIEAFSWSPHLETAAEICLCEAEAGRSAALAFIDVDNPDEDPKGRWRTWLGCGPGNKVDQLSQLLQPHGVASLAQPALTTEVLRQVEEFASQTVRSIRELRRLSYRGAQLGKGVASSLISRMRDPDPDLSADPALVARYLSGSARVFESACHLIQDCRPERVLVFNGRFACSKAIVEAARQLAVRCLFHERGATYQRYWIHNAAINDFTFNREVIMSAWAQAPSDREVTARAFFERRRQGDGIGWISYTGRQVTGTIPKRRRSKRLVYFSSSEHEIEAVDEMTAHTLFESQRHAVEFLADWTRNHQDVELIIRLHPALGRTKRDPTICGLPPDDRVTLDLPDSDTDSYALAESADAVLTYGSTMGVEAAFLGRPSILLCDSYYRGMGCVYEPGTIHELSALLDQPTLAPKPQSDCLPFGYCMLTYGTPYRFYQPSTLFDGAVMGVELSTAPEYLRRFKRSSVGKALQTLRMAVLGRNSK